ncbi:MAG: transcriptional regulator, partial [Undibacterium sp.]|nr:transcriptional regulator [Undibacterium sp.]
GVRGVFTPEQVDFSQLQRSFTIHANDGFSGAWATRLIAATSAEAPGVSLHFLARSSNNIEGLRSGVIDLDIGVARVAEPELVSEPLFDAGFIGVVRDQHPLLDKRTNTGNNNGTNK